MNLDTKYQIAQKQQVVIVHNNKIQTPHSQKIPCGVCGVYNSIDFNSKDSKLTRVSLLSFIILTVIGIS